VLWGRHKNSEKGVLQLS